MVKCSDCGSILPEGAATSGEPCPTCGSVRRQVFAFAGVATAMVTAHSPESVAKERDPDYPKGGWSKPAREGRVGLSMSADGIERSRRREYDHGTRMRT